MLPAEPVPAGQAGLTADALLAGPRGRTLCTSLLGDRLTTPGGHVKRAWVAALDSGQRGDEERQARKLGECVRLAGLSGVPFDGGALMAGLAAAVDFASYWEPPDAEDREFAGEAAREALRPVAQAVAAAAAGLAGVSWWAEPVDQGRQRYVQFLGEDPWPEPMLTGAAGLVRAWLADTRADELSAPDWPEDPSAPFSGWWWSSPVRSRLPVTTRELPAHGAAGLALAEDGHGWQSARCWPVAPRDGTRVCEIHGPGEWADLVDRYPLEVTRSRRDAWWQATGQDGRWLIPDYAAVSGDWDAIHVSVTGYLTTAGIAIPVGGSAHTMLAGWDPDATWWLNDVLSLTSPPEDWQRTSQRPLRWARTGHP